MFANIQMIYLRKGNCFLWKAENMKNDITVHVYNKDGGFKQRHFLLNVSMLICLGKYQLTSLEIA